MTSEIALVICTVFVFYLMLLDRKQTPGVSKSLWIPSIWMVYSASKPLGVWFRWSGEAESGSRLDQLFLCALLALALGILFRRRFLWWHAIRNNLWLVVLICYMFISIAWSDIPFTSFKRWTRELIAVLMAFILLSESNAREAALTVIRRSIYVLIPFSVILIKYFPQYGREYNRWSGAESWVGVALQKNGLGRLCLIAGFFLIWRIFKRWRKGDNLCGKSLKVVEFILVIITFWLMRGAEGAYSASAIMALGFGLVALVAFIWMGGQGIRIKSIGAAIIMGLIICYGVRVFMVGGLGSIEVSAALGRDETLTGRTEVWAELVPLAMTHPVLGGGFGSMWTPSTRLFYRISEGHNGYLDLLLELGFIGLILMSIFLLSSSRKAYRVTTFDFDWGIMFLCYLLMACLHNITETSFNSLTSHLTAVLLFFAVSSTQVSSREQIMDSRRSYASD